MISQPFPKAVVFGRLEMCRTCATPCPSFQGGQLVHADPRAGCPLTPPRWRTWAEVQKRQGRRAIGLGDAVAAVAQPAAAIVDAVAGTDLVNCPGCKQRKRGLNEAVPDVFHPFRRRKK